jgi:hypothetical protein
MYTWYPLRFTLVYTYYILTIPLNTVYTLTFHSIIHLHTLTCTDNNTIYTANSPQEHPDALKIASHESEHILAGMFGHSSQNLIMWNTQLTTWHLVCTCLLASSTFLLYGEGPLGTWKATTCNYCRFLCLSTVHQLLTLSGYHTHFSMCRQTCLEECAIELLLLGLSQVGMGRTDMYNWTLVLVHVSSRPRLKG